MKPYQVIVFNSLYFWKNSFWSLVLASKIQFWNECLWFFLFKILCTGVYSKSWFLSVEGSWTWASNTLDLGQKITLEIYGKTCIVDYEKL